MNWSAVFAFIGVEARMGSGPSEGMRDVVGKNDPRDVLSLSPVTSQIKVGI